MSDDEDDRKHQAHRDLVEVTFLTFGWLLVGLSVVFGLLLGNAKKVEEPGAFGSVESFNWTLAALVFAPIFVSGIILLATAAILERISD